MSDRAADLTGFSPDLTGALVRRVLLGGQADARHRANGFDRVRSDRSLLREHHGIGSVPDRVGHVGRLSTRGPIRGDHRLEHLGGGDHRNAGAVGAVDHVLLHGRQVAQLQLHPEVAAGDHHRVGDLEDRAEIPDCLQLL